MQICGIHVLMSILKCICSIFHCCDYRCVCVGFFQSDTLHLDCRECSVDLLQLLFISLLSFEGLNCSWKWNGKGVNVTVHTFEGLNTSLPHLIWPCVVPLLFFVPFFFATSSSVSIRFSRTSCFLHRMSSVSRKFCIASPVVMACSFFPPNIFEKKLILMVFLLFFASKWTNCTILWSEWTKYEALDQNYVSQKFQIIFNVCYFFSQSVCLWFNNNGRFVVEKSIYYLFLTMRHFAANWPMTCRWETGAP